MNLHCLLVGMCGGLLIWLLVCFNVGLFLFTGLCCVLFWYLFGFGVVYLCFVCIFD